MPLIVSGNVASATAATTFSVDNSCKFFSDTSLHKDNGGSATNLKKYTVSFWYKKSSLVGSQDGHKVIMVSGSGTQGDGSDDYMQAYFKNDDTFRWQEYDGDLGAPSDELITTQKFRDPSAWYHFVLRFDSTSGTADDRMRIYVNGTQVTAFGTRANPDQNTDGWFGDADAGIAIGGVTSQFCNGYLAEVVGVDGQSLAPTSFGEFNEDSPQIWQPVAVSGLTFGNNGFYLDFKASGNLGNDANGGTDFTEVNLAAADQATDTPTNNFCTMNPLVGSTSHTFSEGNCKIVSSGSDTKGGGVGTFGLTAGKWYWEVKLGSLIANHNHGVVSELTPELYAAGGATALSQDTGATTWRNDDGGEVVIDGTVTTADYGIMAEDSIMGIALDMDNHNISYYDDGSALVTDLNISTTRGVIFPLMASGINCTAEVNFGGCSSFTISSAQSDANGYGNFEHAPPSGYLSLCSKNLGSDGG